MSNDQLQHFYGLAIALMAGLVVGLERGWKQRGEEEGERIAGIRTFGLIGVLGGIFGLLGRELGAMALAAGLLSLTGLLAVGYRQSVRLHHRIGLTTSVAGLIVFGLGAVAVGGDIAIAASGAVITTLLLSLKPALHQWLESIEPRELQSAIELLLIAVVIVPLLPNAGYGPAGALNPYQVGWTIVLISGLSFIGYAAVKLAGPKPGILLTGLLGGLVSSTATTMTLARMAKGEAPPVRVLASGISFACAVMVVRMGVLLAIISTPLLSALWVSLGLMTATTVVAGGWLWRSSTAPVALEGSLRNPAELGSALRFGGLLAAILVLAAILKDWFGSFGIIALASISGLADVDAITISVAKLSADQTLSQGTAAAAVLIAASSNMIMKGLLIYGLAGRGLARWTTLVFGVTIAAAVAGYLLIQSI